MNRIDRNIAEAGEAVTRVTSISEMRDVVDQAKVEIVQLREHKQMCVRMLRELYMYFDGISDGAGNVHEREALWRCATITEVLEKVGEL